MLAASFQLIRSATLPQASVNLRFGPHVHSQLEVLACSQYLAPMPVLPAPSGAKHVRARTKITKQLLVANITRRLGRRSGQPRHAGPSKQPRTSGLQRERVV